MEVIKDILRCRAFVRWRTELPLDVIESWNVWNIEQVMQTSGHMERGLLGFQKHVRACDCCQNWQNDYVFSLSKLRYRAWYYCGSCVILTQFMNSLSVPVLRLIINPKWFQFDIFRLVFFPFGSKAQLFYISLMLISCMQALLKTNRFRRGVWWPGFGQQMNSITKSAINLNLN